MDITNSIARAAVVLEARAVDLLRCAERFAKEETGYSADQRRTELFKAAREYAAAIQALARRARRS